MSTALDIASADSRRFWWLVIAVAVASIALPIINRIVEFETDEPFVQVMCSAFAAVVVGMAWFVVPPALLTGGWIWLLTRPLPWERNARKLARARENVERLERELGIDDAQ
jgi:hypothetical protein